MGRTSRISRVTSSTTSLRASSRFATAPVVPTSCAFARTRIRRIGSTARSLHSRTGRQSCSMTLRRNLIGRLERALEVQREESRAQAEGWLDITADLEETLDRFIQLFHEAPVGYLTFDDKGTIIELNGEAARLL